MGKKNKTDKKIIFVHMEPPPSLSTLQIRQNAARTFLTLSSIYNHTKEKETKVSPHSIQHILLDGTMNQTGHIPSLSTLQNNHPDIETWSTTKTSTNCSLKENIPNSDRNIIQAIVNSANRVHQSENGSARQSSAKEKLTANLIIVKEMQKGRQQQQFDQTSQNNSNKSSSKVQKGSATLTIKKMKILGMIHDQEGSKNNKGRELAMTRWLDKAEVSPIFKMSK